MSVPLENPRQSPTQSHTSPVSARLLVVGGYGAVGTRICHALAAVPGIEIIVAGRRLSEANILASTLGSQSRALDLHDSSTWSDACENVDCVVMCMDQADTSFVSFLFERGIHYVDITASDSFFRAVERLNPAHSSAMLSVGLAPGITNILAAHGASRLDTVERIEIGLLFGLGDHHGEAGLEWMSRRLFDPARPREVLELRFGFGQGHHSAHPVDFSDQHALLRTLDIQAATTRVAFESRFATAALFRLAGAFAGNDLVRRAVFYATRKIRFGSDLCNVSVHVHGRFAHQPMVASLHFAGREEISVTAGLAAIQIEHFLRLPPPPGVHHSHTILDTKAVLEAVEWSRIGTVAIDPLRPDW